MMYRALIGAALAACVCGATTTAHAQSARAKNYESPQHFAAEFRLGLYYPKIDSEFGGGQTPFKDSFGDNCRLFIGGEFDWQTLRIPYVGTLGPGFGVHWFKFSRPAKFADGSGSADESNTLSVMPMHALAVLRVDVLAREVGIPLVPYVKGGLGLAHWRQTNGGGTARLRDEAGNTLVVGKGLSFGPQFAIGAMFLLDWLDPYSAQQADGSLGVNNTYVFAELFMSKLDWAFSGKALHLGDTSVVGGLAFEF